MKILFITGYPAWNKVANDQMPSHHLFGMNELISEYKKNENGQLYGVLKNEICGGGTVDFYLWEGGKKNILPQVAKLIKKSREYNLYYDCLNRCSLYLGFMKNIAVLKCKLLTIMHHPSYDIQLKVSSSDQYVFFHDSYLQCALNAAPKKKNRFVVNEWLPDVEWYSQINDKNNEIIGFFIDNGKSRRDKEIMIEAANKAKVKVTFASKESSYDSQNYATPYKIDLKDDFAIAKKMRHYISLIVPVLDNHKNVPIGPLGATSFLDALALEMPILASDNVYFADYIKQNSLGKVYKTGDKESLIEAMKEMHDNSVNIKEYKKNIRKYRDNRTIFDYAERLHSIIEEIMEK